MPHADELGVEDVFDVVTQMFGIEGKVNHDEFHFLCVVHTDSNPSADCNLKTGLWSCFSCGASGDLIDLGIATLLDDGLLYAKDMPKPLRRKRMEQRDRVKGMLVPDNEDAQAAATRRRLRASLKRSEEVTKKVALRGLDIPPLGSYEDGPLDELYERGFTDDHLRKWNVRYVTSARLTKEDGKDFEISHSIAIPIVEEDGETVIGWMYRSTDRSEDWQPRYLYTPGVILSEIWFGLDQCFGAEEVTVTEGGLDAMWNDQHGYPGLAILGSNVKNQKKLRKLNDYRRVCLFPDNDNAGLLWAARVGRALQDMGTPVTVVRLASWMLNRKGKPAKDANDLCSLDLELVRELAIPFQAWKRKNPHSEDH